MGYLAGWVLLALVWVGFYFDFSQSETAPFLAGGIVTIALTYEMRHSG